LIDEEGLFRLALPIERSIFDLNGLRELNAVKKTIKEMAIEAVGRRKVTIT